MAAGAPFTDKLLIRKVVSSYPVNSGSVSMVVREVKSSAGPFVSAERRTRTTRAGTTISIVHEWIDGRRCPALAEVYVGMPETWAQPDRQTPPPFHGDTVAMVRVGLDSLRDYEGPVTGWLRAVEPSLRPCWTQDRSFVDNAPLPLTLETDSDEAPFVALVPPN